MHEYLDILFDSYLVDAKLVIGKKPILIEIHEGERMQEAWAIWNGTLPVIVLGFWNQLIVSEI